MNNPSQIKMNKKEERVVTFYFMEEHGGHWSVKDENGMLRGWATTHNSFEDALSKAQEYTFGYYSEIWHTSSVRFVIDKSVFRKDVDLMQVYRLGQLDGQIGLDRELAKVIESARKLNS